MKPTEKPLGFRDIVGPIEFQAIAVLVAAAFTYLHYSVPIKIFSAADWVNGTVDMPMASRVLAADLVTWLVKLAGVAPDSGFVPLAFQGLEFAAFLIASLAVILTTATLTGSRQASYLSYALFVWEVFYTFVISPRHRFWYSYDIITLAVLSLALLLIVQNRFGALLALTALGAWNRETVALAAFFYALYNITGQGKTLRLSAANGLRAALLFVVSVIVKSLVLYLHGKGSDVISLYHEGTTLRLWRNLMIWQGGVYACLGAFGFLWVLAPRAWAIMGDAPLARLAWVFPLFLALMLVVGNVDEIRIFAEFIPYLAVLLGVAWHRSLATERSDYKAQSLRV